MRAIYLVFAVWIGLIGPVDAAVEFLTGVNRDTIAIGDPFVLRMRISRDADDKAEIAFGEDFPGPFEIRHRGEPETVNLDNGRVRETHDLVLVIYKVGTFQIPPVFVNFVTADGDSGKIESQQIDVLVQSVKPEGETDIRDVKPPVVVVTQIPMWFWVVLGVCVLVLAGVIWYLIRRRRRPQEDLPPPPVNWMDELQSVGSLGLLEQENYRQYYSLLSDVLRRCLEAKTSVKAVEETSFEITRDLRAQAFDDQFVADLERFLNEADLVKFAKFAPQPSAAAEAMGKVQALVKVLIKPPIETGAK